MSGASHLSKEQNSGAAPQSSALREDSVNESLSIGAASLSSNQQGDIEITGDLHALIVTYPHIGCGLERAIKEIERLTRELGDVRATLQLRESERNDWRDEAHRLRAALEDIVAMWRGNANDLDFTYEMMRAASEALSGERPPDEAGEKS